MTGFPRLGAAALFCAAAVLLQAQQFSPHIGYVYPAGGKAGETFEVTIGGQFLDGVNTVTISGRGVQAAVAKHNKLMTQGQFNKLREELRELTEKRTEAQRQQRKGVAAGEKKVVYTDEDEKRAAEIRAKLATFIRRPLAPSIAEQVKVLVTIAPDAPPGERELRLGTPNGLTNPLLFVVGQLPEVSRKPAKVIDDAMPVRAMRYRTGADDDETPDPVTVTLPVTVNGQIRPGGVDHYKFKATKGQKIVIAASARELIPYISDAVPGWFQATLTLYDSKGKEVEYAGNYRFHPDPVLYYEIAEDGEYTLEVRDSIYRGREDFVYRITMGEIPFVTSVFPLGGKAGVRTPVEVKGWNLPTTRLSQDMKVPGVYPVSVRKGDLVSNRVPFAIDTLPERIENEPNNDQKRAQSVKLPIIINGRIQQPGDTDVFKFEAKAGEEIVAEVFARRLDSPIDSILRLTDHSGKQLAFNDDHEDKGSGLLTHHADSRILFKAPANGTYYVHVADAQRKGGPEYAYRLRISRPQPDFDLRVVPASISARGGSTVPITVYAIRKDGFVGDITLRLKDAPRGFTLEGGWIPANQDKVRCTLTVPLTQTQVPINLQLEGRAMLQSKEIVRKGVPAEDMMQAFFYRHLVPAQEWMVRISPAQRGRVPWRIALDKPPLKLPAGGTAPVRLLAPIRSLPENIKLVLNEPPEGITIEGVTPGREGLNIVLRADASKVKPGTKGNLIVDAFFEGAAPAKKAAQARRQQIGTLPAIPFEVVPNLEARR